MAKKSAGEKTLIFALKVVGPVVLAFVVAIGLDVSRAIRAVDSAPVERWVQTPGVGYDLTSEVEYRWYMLF